jgi:predicted  nucleic acid-binding Zn-ribbon protein
MASFSRRSRSHESEDAAGWIAMVDVFSLFAVVAIGVGAAQIAKLTKQISIMPGDWTSVVKEHSDLRARVQAFEAELSALRIELALATDTLTAERDSNSKLRTELERLTGQLEDCERRLAALKIAEVEIPRLELDLAQATAQVNALLDQKAALEQELVEARTALNRARVQLAEVQSLLVACRRELEKIRSEVVTLRAENEALRGKFGSIGRGEAELRRQLLGLDGELGRVVFVLDRSGSMDVKDKRTGRNRWQDAISTIDAWLRYLAVDEAALVVFSGGIDVFPPDGRWVSLSKEGAGPLLEGLKDLSPMGATNTLEALRRAYRYPEVKVIILFTDGAPDSGKDGGVGTADDILRFVANQKAAGLNVRIHTVGIGDYFSPRMRDFLLQLSGETGGTFIGR